jgi:2-phosphosulfolactate phosphatase
MTPALIDQFDIRGANVVVIDVLRATTSMCVAFDHGAKFMHPVAEVAEAEAFRSKGYLLAGERNGIKVEGFDLGNSPFDFMPALRLRPRMAQRQFVQR